MSEPRVWIVYQPSPRSGVRKRHKARRFKSPSIYYETLCGQHLLDADILYNDDTRQTKRCKTCFWAELAAEKD